jgi:hypothetical protein
LVIENVQLVTIDVSFEIMMCHCNGAIIAISIIAGAAMSELSRARSFSAQ